MELISRQALNDYMRFRKESNRSLAAGTRGVVGHAIIGHLRTGKRKTCSPQTATAIEKALNAPPGSLFGPKVAIGSPAVGRVA